MSHLVLYRKYRPKTFKEIVGQEHVVQTLTNALFSGNISHAYLFAGPRGTGKTTIARLLAKAVNCKNRKKEETEPCNQCDSCQEINRGNAIDLIEIDAASNRGIDEIRDLRDGIRFVPTKSKYKVFILDEAHQLSKDAANALLKTLEEPPSHAIFILATTEPHKMISTIVSRCQRFDFRRLSVPEISIRLETILKKEKINFEKESLNLIALTARGSIRDAESLLDEVVSFSGKERAVKKEQVSKLLGIADKVIILKFLDYLCQKKTSQAIEFLQELIFKGIDLQEFVRSLVQYLREILLLKIDSQFQNPLILGLSREEKRELEKLAKSFSERELKEILEKFTLAEQKIKYASIPQLPLELAIIEICHPSESD
ncbi:MAG: DNA polymerase III subunit gamma/tau [Patescibacteria group bacterium]|nr:DNA polymerase III subunit gamma/tau [Patescibacteria group bacterium]